MAETPNLEGQTKLGASLEGDSFCVSRLYDDQHLRINFKRTIRVPDNRGTSELPPSLGDFPLYATSKYAKNMPQELAAKGGVFFPMYQREAMWINFKSNAPFAIKIVVGGVNAVSGEPVLEDEDTTIRLLNRLQIGKSIQDYVVVPDQKWIDGIAVEGGKVRQFVAMPTGSGYSVEAQITGKERMGGIQFEVTPHVPYSSNKDSAFPIEVRTLAGKTINMKVMKHQTVRRLKTQIQDLEGTPPDQQRLIYAGRQLDDNEYLGETGVRPDATLHLTLALRGGGYGPAPEEVEMGVAAGGLINQSIIEDRHEAISWDKNETILFNVQIVNSEMFRNITGLEPPKSPVSAETYAAAGRPFFKLYEEVSTVSGGFGEVKSIAELNEEKDGGQAEEKPHDFPLILTNPEGPEAPFRSVSELEESVRKMNLTS